MSSIFETRCHECILKTVKASRMLNLTYSRHSRRTAFGNSYKTYVRSLTSFSSPAVQSSIQSQKHPGRRNFSRRGPLQHIWMQELVDEKYDPSKLILKPDNLYHKFSRSPIAAIRKRAAYIKQHAYCPHPTHMRTRLTFNPDDPENRKPISSGAPPAHVHFECPDCGIPVYCSEGHWMDDYEEHVKICNTLREINEDEHDLHSGRYFYEFHYPAEMIDEALVNFENWDTYAYTRGFHAMDDMRNMRQATRLITYPATIGSILHELSPYNVKPGGRLTPEGLKSFSALRYTLHQPLRGQGMGIKGLRTRAPPVRLFVLGARAESSLPRDVWHQIAYLFTQHIDFHLILIGPEAMVNRDSEYPLPERTPRNPFGAIIEDRLSHQMKISTYLEYYHTLHRAQNFHPYDPYFDCFVLFHPGLGHPASAHEWEDTLPQLLETKVPIIVTGYTQFDMERDLKWVYDKVGGEIDVLLEPGENRFRSLRWELNDLDPNDVSASNWGVWAFRGKRYETTTTE